MSAERRFAASVLGHDFARPDLLDEALTHPSAGVRGGRYERLEFLGDRVLALVVAGMLLGGFPDEDEGALAKRLAALVRRETLADVAARIGLGERLRLSRGEDESGGRSNPSVLADAMEAVIGALYLDGGLEPAHAFIERHWEPAMSAAEHPPEDAKTRLQEWAQGAGRPLPRYRTVATTGPAHSPTFSVEVSVEGGGPETGSGPSKRAAEQVAAAALLELLDLGGKAGGKAGGKREP